MFAQIDVNKKNLLAFESDEVRRFFSIAFYAILSHKFKISCFLLCSSILNIEQNYHETPCKSDQSMNSCLSEQFQFYGVQSMLIFKNVKRNDH